jgi:hypothetical protein
MIKEIVAYKLRNESELARVQGILTLYLIDNRILRPGRDMSVEGHSFAKGSAFNGVFIRNGLLNELYEPVYKVQRQAFYESTIKKLINERLDTEITFGKMVELLNETADEFYMQQSVDFAEWIANNQFAMYDSIWRSTKLHYLGESYTTKELFKHFKNNQDDSNGK